MRKLAQAAVWTSVALFILSGLNFATRSQPQHPTGTAPAPIRSESGAVPELAGMLLVQPPADLPGGLAAQLLAPQGPVQWLFLLLVWIAAAAYSLRLSGWIARPQGHHGTLHPRSHEPPFHEPTALSIGLLMGAIWPWVIWRHPPTGMALALIGFIAVMSPLLGRGGKGVSVSLGVLAGWITVVTCAAFATFLDLNLGTPQTLSALIALLFCALAALAAQLRIGAPFAYSATMILGLLGIAAATMGVNPMIAMATTIALSVVAATLIRVAT